MSENRATRRTSRRVRQRRTIAVAGAIALVVVGAVVVGAVSSAGTAPAGPGAASGAEPSVVPSAVPSAEPAAAAGPRPSPGAEPAPAVVPRFDKAALSIDDPNSIWLVVNKLRPLNPADFVPADLVSLPGGQMRAEAADAFLGMADGAAADGHVVIAASAYRSHAEQAAIYAGDDTVTARPGYSEHQTGLTVDIATPSGQCRILQCFGEMAEGAWLRDHAWEHGFLLRYPADKTEITGYDFEPWHFRYIGLDLAREMHDRGVTTLEEFFGLQAAPVYP